MTLKKFLVGLGMMIGLFTFCMMPVLANTICPNDITIPGAALLVAIYLGSLSLAVGGGIYLTIKWDNPKQTRQNA